MSAHLFILLCDILPERMEHRRSTLGLLGKHFRLCLSFIRVSDRKPVVFKEDGLRFASPETIKFGLGESYEVFLTFEPTVKITSLSIHNDLIEVCRLGTKIDPNVATYGGVWEAGGFPVTHCHHREQVKVAVGFDDGSLLITTLQCKFYAKEAACHCAWGETMHAIHYQCVFLPDKSVSVVKQELM